MHRALAAADKCARGARLIVWSVVGAARIGSFSAVAVWRAALCANWRKHISAGEGAVVILLGADKKQAAILRRYCQGLLQAPLLAAEVTRQTGEVTEFRNGASLEIATNDARLVRGRSAIAVLGSRLPLEDRRDAARATRRLSPPPSRPWPCARTAGC